MIYYQSNYEASKLDRIKMTKNWLEYDRKIFTMTNVTFFTIHNSAYFQPANKWR